jgi:hypothetical protein
MPFMIPGPPDPPTNDELLWLGKMQVLAAWGKMPDAFRKEVSLVCEVQPGASSLRILLASGGTESSAEVPLADCLERERIGAHLASAVRLITM